jgi:peptide/nickel transport system substrate-binding protein
MKRYSSILLAASSLLWALNAPGEVRPHYGGTLHIAMREQCPALDPPVSPACANISRLIFETLVQLDRQGHPQPLLAISWQSEPGSQRWRFLLRSGVSFHDGTSLDSSLVAASLRNAHPDWKVLPVGESVIVETGSPDPNLPAELALAGNAIVRRGGAHPLGTGPFAIQAWDPGKRLSLVANDRYSASRPFLDGIEVDFSRNARDQMLALDIGKADVADVAPEDIRRARADGRSVVSSEPAELMALLFAADPRSEDETHLRTALALGLDTASMNDVVLQGGGEPASSLLPNWLSGYAFAFGSGRNLERARQERMLAKHAAPLSLCYDTGDAVALVIAERVVLNAKDAGISLQLATSSACDVKLLRIPLNSLDPRVALHELAKGLNLPAPGFANGSVEELYNAEKTLLQTHRVIPLLHLRSAVALRSNVHGFAIFPGGTWDLSNLWLSTERP